MRIALALPALSLALVLASTASAQYANIRPGQTAEGRLSASGPTMDENGTHYRCYYLIAEAGQLYQITLTAEDFDALLSVTSSDDCTAGGVKNDDAPDMGTNSQVKFFARGGRAAIRVNTVLAGEVGRYSLAISKGTVVSPTRDLLPLTLGTTVAGDLGFGDRVSDDGSFFDCYRLPIGSDERLFIRMESPDFDAFLGLYLGDQCEGAAFDSNDDVGDDTSNAQIVQSLKQGHYSIRANSLLSDSVGAYTLTTTVQP